MGELNADDGAVCVREVDDALQRRDLAIGPDALGAATASDASGADRPRRAYRVLWGDTPFWDDRGRLHADRAEAASGKTLRKRTQMLVIHEYRQCEQFAYPDVHKVPVGGVPVVRAVLAHRRLYAMVNVGMWIIRRFTHDEDSVVEVNTANGQWLEKCGQVCILGVDMLKFVS